jgi:hypothetical protein
MMRRNALIAALALLDAIIVLHLAGSVTAAAMFLAFVAGIVIPAVALARRAAPLPLAAAIVIVAAVPWFFLRKAVGMPLVVDAATAAVLMFFAWRTRALPAGDSSPSTRLGMTLMPLVTFGFVPIVFSLVWLGWNVPAGNELREYGLFGIDFGNLVSVVTSLRASPMLPLSYVDGAGALSYHWLYFTIPAALADFGGGSMPNANALILANLLVALLLVEAVRSIATDWRAAAIVLFAPLTTYFYQVLSARLPLGPLALPTRNHLLLSPLNSMIVFGNNSVALVLAIVALTQLERWNRDGRVRDLVAGCIALAAIIGYSITLLFPLALALVVWTLFGRVRRPLVALPLAAAAGALAAAIFLALHIVGGGGTRHLALAFDRGQFLRMVILGMVPLWFLARRRELTIFHVVIASCIAVPSMLYIAGSPTGASDFSMKIASLLAISFAPLIVIPTGWRALVAALVVAAGVIQSAAYVLQFPFYRLRHVTTNGVGLPRDYAGALAWIRENTPASAIVIDPHELNNREEIFTLILGERRVWLPTAYAKEFLINGVPPAVAQRERLWHAFPASAEAMAREADVLLVPFAISSPAWRPVHREGAWIVYRSALRSAPR